MIRIGVGWELSLVVLLLGTTGVGVISGTRVVQMVGDKGDGTSVVGQ